MLAVRDLACGRGGMAVLGGVSFVVPAGSVLILRGPNGVGKTTLLRTLAGLQPALAGSVDCLTEEIAYGSHADGVKAQLSVAENLAFWARVYGLHDIGPALAAFDLGGLRGRMAGTLSAGQKRRLGLARLAVIDRKVLLLDEPTVSLDAGSVRLFNAYLHDVHLARGGIAVIATHIDLGLEAATLDLWRYRADIDAVDGRDEVFL
jgi:heme exporter protein A